MLEDEFRTGHMTSSIIEKELLEYIKAYTVNGVYVGEVRYLQDYKMISDYNSSRDVKFKSSLQ